MKLACVWVIVLSIAISACSTTQEKERYGIPSDVYKKLEPSAEVNLDFSLLRSISCGAVEDDKPFQSTMVMIKEAQLFDLSNLPDGVTFVGGWQLNSRDPRVQSLSGLHALSDLELLAVSDTGSFVRIKLVDYEPTGTVQVAEMLDELGRPLRASYLADAEGITSKDGIAFVAFEQFHRVDAYALNECGSLARPARVAELPIELGQISVAPEKGPKAINWLSNLMVLYEAMNEYATLGMNLGNETRSDYYHVQLWNLDPQRTSAVVGMTNAIKAADQKDAWYYRLRRFSEDSGGYTFAVEVSHEFARPFESGYADFILFELHSPQKIADFQGIAAQSLPSGKHRIWVVSDNGGSKRHPNLLFGFDVDPTYRIDGPGGRTHFNIPY